MHGRSVQRLPPTADPQKARTLQKRFAAKSGNLLKLFAVGENAVRVAMLDAGLFFFWPDGMLRHSLMGDGVERFVVPGERYQIMDTADGKLVIWMSRGDQQRAALRAVGRSDLADDPRHRFVRGDIRDRELVRSLLEEEAVDAVVHFAAESHVDRSVEGPEVFVSTNVLGTEILLEDLSQAVGGGADD